MGKSSRGSATVILASCASFGHHAWTSETSWSDSDGGHDVSASRSTVQSRFAPDDSGGIERASACLINLCRAGARDRAVPAADECESRLQSDERQHQPIHQHLCHQLQQGRGDSGICVQRPDRSRSEFQFCRRDRSRNAGLCAPVFATGGPVAHDLLVSIVLQSPTECSQGTDYPGKCRVLGSLEISGDVEGQFVNRIHLEPVLLPGSPGRPQIPITPR